ncbi:MAG TPA: hypothetical protein VME46_04485 [Acidimicrobiales bacterium]|nr:hypothetical protein [Acidimicrobiales bacterium]
MLPVGPLARAAAASALALAFVGLVVVLYYLSTRSFRANSDAASTLLQGQSMAGGNFGLRGWRLSLDSFWLSDTVFYALFVAVLGVKAKILYLMPAAVAALAVYLGMYLAGTGHARWPGWSGALTVFALLGLPSSFLAPKLLASPVHVVTALWCLAAFACVRRLRFDWRFAVAVGLIGVATVSDLVALAIGIVPLFLAGLAAMARARSMRAGTVPVAAAAGGAVTSLALRALASQVGWLAMASRQHAAKMARVANNVPLMFHYTFDVFGIGTSAPVRGHAPAALELVHVMAFVVGVALLVAVIRLAHGVLRREPSSAGLEASFLDDVLLIATCGSAASFLGLTVRSVPAEARYLLPGLIFSSVLAGRFVAGLAERVPAGRPRRGLQVGGLVAVLAFAAGVGYDLDVPVPRTPYPQIAKFLVAHHLHDGLADYWTAAIVTVDSDDRVSVRPVSAVRGKIYPTLKDNSDVNWYQGARFTYLVYSPRAVFDGVRKRTAERTWGRPARIYHVAGYLVMIWHHSLRFEGSA